MKTFRSKKDWWVVAFVVCMTGLLIQLLLTMYAKGTMQQYPAHTAVYILTVLLIWWPLLNTRYVLDAHELRIKCMFLTWRIPRAQISQIESTHNSVASPALSLDRLKIEYEEEGKTHFVLISPKRKSEFLKAMQLDKN